MLGLEILIFKVSPTIEGVLKTAVSSAAAKIPAPLNMVAKEVSLLSMALRGVPTPTNAVAAPTPKSIAPKRTSSASPVPQAT
ncbi:hypothetical protein D9M72_371660 [compost metagenome]